MAKILTQTGGFYYAKYQFKRSMLENALITNYTSEEHGKALKYFSGCAYCGNTPAPRKDHLVAVFECGDFVSQNVVPACQPCDDSKGKQDYHTWMRNSSSQQSLKNRGFTDKQIEDRIKLIEKWQSGYKPKIEAELFGPDYPRYRELLRKMDKLCQEAEEMTHRVRARG